jgi:hypothetical protein
MKKIRYITLIVCLTTVLYAQNNSIDAKRDYVWKMGYEGYYRPTDTMVGSITLNFNHTPREITVNTDSAGLSGANASICDSLGNLLFYTNNIFIYGADGLKLAGSDTLNSGYFSDPVNGGDTGYLLFQTVLILPLPNSHNLYYVLHQRATSLYYPMVPSELYYSIVDMTAENGRGRVISSRNRLSNNTTFSNGKVTATRHANGRDWWIVQWAADYAWYYTFLLTPQGIQDKGQHTINTALPPGLGQAVFSPDGSKYATITSEVWLPITHERVRIDNYDFDRCEGIMSRRAAPMYIEESGIGGDTLGAFAIGCSISPNSRYLYITRIASYTQSKYYQYDLYAANIAASRLVVAEYDGFIDPDFQPVGHTLSWTHQLAPDGKIYISTGDGTHYLNTINAPDSAGVACNVQQHSIRLPAFNFRSLPNHPNYRLGRLVDSSCDTLYVSTESPPSEDIEGIKVFPNPAYSELNIQCPNFQNKQIIITNALGVSQKILSLQSETTTINIQNLSNGIYYVSIYENNKLLATTKLVVLHE